MLSKTIFYAVIGLAFTFVVTGTQAKTSTDFNKSMEFSKPEKAILVNAKNPVVTLKLKSNVTTGFSWFLTDYNSRFLSPMKQKYVAPATDKMGAGGYELWTFRLKPTAFAVPRIMHITMIYAQPWDLAHHVNTKFTIVTRK